MKDKTTYSLYLAEFIGTFFLVFFGCGAIILSELNTEYNASFIPIIFGGTVSIMIYAVGHISGAHFNPAVTIAFWLIKKFPSKRLFGYILSQLSGALMASVFHLYIFGSKHTFGKSILTTNHQAGPIIEILLSFILMFVIISVATDSRAVGELAGIAIGTTVSLCAFFGGPLTGASMNPARTLGPAILSMDFSSLWIYLLAPILGTTLGAYTYEKIRCQMNDEDVNDSSCC